MKLVPLQDVHPGVVLAADVRDRHGRFLLGRGVAIEPGHLRILRIWGVTDVHIEQDGKAPDPDRDEHISPETLQRAEEIITLRLASATDETHAAALELRRILVQFTARLLSADNLTEVPGLERPAPEDFQKFTESDFSKGQKHIQALLDKDLELASLPTIFNRVLGAINNPRSSAVHVAEVISQDPSLSARLLRIANSAFYGFPGRIESISRAVTIIGTRQLGTLALGAAVIDKFQNIPEGLMDMQTFWGQSIACGMGARFLSSLKFLSNSESFFVAGLIHGLGQLVMLKYFPEQTLQAMLLSRTRNIRLHEAEQHVFGFDHAWLGGEIMNRWKLPRRMEQSVRHQYAPLKSEYPAETTVLHLAGILARGLALGQARDMPVIPALDCSAWDRLQLTVGTLSTTLNHMESQVDAMYRLLFTAPGEQG